VERSVLRTVPLAAIVATATAVVAIVLSGAPLPDERGRPAPAAASAPRSATTFTLGWVGDITPGSRYGLPAGEGDALFSGLRRWLRAPDLMIGNLEGTLGSTGTAKCGMGVANCYAFQAPPANARALARAGFDLMNVANNHANDYGPEGMRQTMQALAAAGVGFAGVADQETGVVVRRGIRIATVGFSTYAWTPSLTDAVEVRSRVREADKVADVVVVLFHGGAEGSDRTHTPPGPESYLGEPRGDLRAFAHAAVDAGADVVLGSGPHVLRGMERYRGRLLAYSLGNFAGVHNFVTGGVLSLSGLLTARVRRDGSLHSAFLRSVVLDASGRPAPHSARQAARLVSALSRQDFGAAGMVVGASGRLKPAGRGGSRPAHPW
jgi:Bacterial capsule synthesis protein PGA_cap